MKFTVEDIKARLKEEFEGKEANCYPSEFYYRVIKPMFDELGIDATGANNKMFYNTKNFTCEIYYRSSATTCVIITIKGKKKKVGDHYSRFCGTDYVWKDFDVELAGNKDNLLDAYEFAVDQVNATNIAKNDLLEKAYQVYKQLRDQYPDMGYFQIADFLNIMDNNRYSFNERYEAENSKKSD